jgi:hypothetical protein
MATVYANAGKDITTNRLKAAGTEPTFIGWGTGAGTAAITDTTLFTESAEARVNGTSARATTTVTNDTWRLTGTLTASAARPNSNAGCFDATTAGNHFVKGDNASTTLASGESIAYTIDLKFA